MLTNATKLHGGSKAAQRRPFTAASQPTAAAISRRTIRSAHSSSANAHKPADGAAAQQPSSSSTTSRRQLLAAASLAAMLSAAPLLPAGAAEAAATAPSISAPPEGFKVLYDPILAYQFAYPVATTSGSTLSMNLSHPPEKYSSAAPLTADARQRIVSELFDLRRFVTVSMSVGPASGVLKDQPQAEWQPRDVALTVLVDRSTARMSSGQRTALNDIEEVHSEEREGQTYVVYEHTSQGSPTVANPRPETFRHALAVSTTRPGLDGTPYLYTLNFSCPQPLWADLAGPFKQAVDSFRLVATTDGYVPPDKNPWLFF